MNKPRVGPNFLDRAFAFVDPERGLRRLGARMKFEAAAETLSKRSHGYEGAAVGRRGKDWRPRSTSADSEIAHAGRRLRDRVRDLGRNTPEGAEAVSIWEDYLVGNGIEARADTGDDGLDEKINDLWEEWSPQCDAEGRGNFHAMTALAVREMVEGGECFARQRVRNLSDGLAVPLQIQLLESDHLDESRSLTTPVNGGRTIRGIEYDPLGRRSGYYLFKDHPGEFGLFMRSLESNLVPAAAVAHLFRRGRVQQRGVPWGSPIIIGMKDFDEWNDAELVRKKTEACIAAFIMGGDDDMAVAPQGTTSGGLKAVDAAGNPVEELQPGLIAYCANGKTIEFNKPAPMGGFAESQSAYLHRLAAGWGVPYELLTGDLSGVNYSSIRTGLIKFKRRCERLQWQLVIPDFCQPVWDWFIQAAFLAGEIPVARAAVQWAPPAFEEVDRTKEALADLIELRSGTLTMPQVIARKGWNPSEQAREIAKWNELADTLGFVLDSDPRKTSRAGLTQARPDGTMIPNTDVGPAGETDADEKSED